MAAETVAEEMAENITKEVAETEIVIVKLAETKKVLKLSSAQHSFWVFWLKFSKFICH